MPEIEFGFGTAVAAAKYITLAAQVHMFIWLHRFFTSRGQRWGVWGASVLLLVGIALTGTSDLFKADRILFAPDRAPVAWRLLSSVWVTGACGTYVLALAVRSWRWLQSRQRARYCQPSHSVQPASGAMSRRRLVSSVAQAAVGAPFAAAAYGTFIGRTQFELREVDLALPRLPPSLEGLRILQLTDIHLGPYLTAQDLKRAVGMANETKPHLAVVTGDLVTREFDPLEKCLDILSELKAEAGVYGCMGNHERFVRGEEFTEARGRSLDIEFLRQRAEALRFGDATLNLCGIDYLRRYSRDLSRAKELVTAGAFNLLLSHNPDVFPVAADMGYDLLVAGHTHGGQVTVEIVEQWVNPGRFYTPYVAGEYRRGDSTIYVSRGIGTVNLPMRVGALPEITLLRLHRARDSA